MSFFIPREAKKRPRFAVGARATHGKHAGLRAAATPPCVAGPRRGRRAVAAEVGRARRVPHGAHHPGGVRGMVRPPFLQGRPFGAEIPPGRQAGAADKI